MRKMIFYGLMALCTAFSPFLALLFPRQSLASAETSPPAAAVFPAATPQPVSLFPQAQSTPAPTEGPAALAAQPLTVQDAATGQQRTVEVLDYLIGCAACEVPVTWPDAAIQAQMIASHSYTLYLQQHSSDPRNINSALCLGWTDRTVLQSRWGSSFEENYDRLRRLAEPVLHTLLLYEDAPADACYFACSNGRTEASQNVWLNALPYLQGVDSAWDSSAEGFEVTIEYSADQMAAMLEPLLEEAPDPADADSWIGRSVWDSAGYIHSIELCGETLPGTEVQDALNLRSACFAMAYRNEMFVITTRGFGHGVGLSQQGARAMAEGGSGWRDILLYYFPGCEIG